MNLPDNVQTVILRPREMQLLGAAIVLLAVFSVGFFLDSNRLMCAGIFGCLIVQGMRK